jgi:hypothetical protein
MHVWMYVNWCTKEVGVLNQFNSGNFSNRCPINNNMEFGVVINLEFVSGLFNLEL